MTDAGFSNAPLDVSSIPHLRDEDFVPVHPNFLKVSMIGSAVWAAIVLIAGIVVAVAVPEYKWIPLLVAGVVLLLTLISVVLKRLEVKNIAYQVREHDLSYRHGVLIKTVQTVPFVRVQHAELIEGPIQRKFGLATLNVNSAGPDLSIDGLGTEDASRLRALVVERAGELTEDQ